MVVKRMSLDGCNEQKSEEAMTLNEFLKANPNIIVAPGTNWCSLRQVSDEQLAQLERIFKREGIRCRIDGKFVGLHGHAVHVLQDRKWLQDPKFLPGKQEKAWLISQLEEAKQTGEYTGISPEFCDELLEKLYAMPGTEDIEGYDLQFHY